MADPVVHLAGTFADRFQVCVRCGVVLTDYRGKHVEVYPPLWNGVLPHLAAGSEYAVNRNGGLWLIEKPDAFDVAARCQASEVRHVAR